MDFLSGWWAWALTGGLGIGLVGWFLGLPALLKILASVVEIVTPLLRAVVEAVIGLVSWLWMNILWPGLKDIADSLATIITVVALVGAMFFYVKVNDDIRYNHLQRELSVCQAALKKAKRTSPKLAPPTLWEFRWPS